MARVDRFTRRELARALRSRYVRGLQDQEQRATAALNTRIEVSFDGKPMFSSTLYGLHLAAKLGSLPGVPWEFGAAITDYRGTVHRVIVGVTTRG